MRVVSALLPPTCASTLLLFYYLCHIYIIHASLSFQCSRRPALFETSHCKQNFPKEGLFLSHLISSHLIWWWCVVHLCLRQMDKASVTKSNRMLHIYYIQYVYNIVFLHCVMFWRADFLWRYTHAAGLTTVLIWCRGFCINSLVLSKNVFWGYIMFCSCHFFCSKVIIRQLKKLSKELYMNSKLIHSASSNTAAVSITSYPLQGCEAL